MNEIITQPDFCIEVDYEKDSPNPSRIFKAMSDLIDTFQKVDTHLVNILDRAGILLEDIEASSLKAWLRTILNKIPDDADGWLINYNFFKQNEGCGNIPPAQAASKLVPCKDWNDVVIPEGASDLDYQVSLYRRKSVKGKYPVYDAALTPIEVSKQG